MSTVSSGNSDTSARVNSTMQVKITSDAMGRIGLGLLLVKFIETGGGTVLRNYVMIFHTCMLYPYILELSFYVLSIQKG